MTTDRLETDASWDDGSTGPRTSVERLWFPASLVIFVGLWEFIVRATGVNAVLFPAPSSVWSSLWRGISSWGPTSYYPHAWVTLQEVIFGFVAGCTIGLLLGGLVALSRSAQLVLRPYIVMFQAVPKIAIAPLMVVWLGFGIESKIALGILVTFFPVFVNTISGVRSVPHERLELMTSLHATRWQSIKTVVVPSSLPFVFAGLEIAAVYAVIAAIVSEFISGQMGLGVLLIQRNFRLDIAGVFAILVILGLMGVAMTKMIELLRRKIVFWEGT